MAEVVFSNIIGSRITKNRKEIGQNSALHMKVSPESSKTTRFNHRVPIFFIDKLERGETTKRITALEHPEDSLPELGVTLRYTEVNF